MSQLRRKRSPLVHFAMTTPFTTDPCNLQSEILNLKCYIRSMPASIELERRLRWADADAAGRLHFPRIFEIIEEAESELVRRIGLTRIQWVRKEKSLRSVIFVGIPKSTTVRI